MGNQEKVLLQGRLDGRQRNRLKGLLDMLYTPKEIAEEVGINKNQIYRVYIPGGCPYSRDTLGHIFIHGVSFKMWYEGTFKKVRMEKNQAWCVSCKKVVTVSESKRYQKGRLNYDLYICPDCGKNIAKIVDAKRKKI